MTLTIDHINEFLKLHKQLIFFIIKSKNPLYKFVEMCQNKKNPRR
jgi:hypothetical protein